MGWVVLLAGTLSVLLAAPAANATFAPTVERWEIEEYYADFEYRVDGELQSYSVTAELVRDADSGEVLKKRIFAGILPCTEHDDGSVECGGRMHEQRLLHWGSDEAFQSALLVFEGSGQRHRLRFKAAEPYQASGTEQGSRCYGVYRYDLALNASVTGTLFGKPVSTQTDLGRSMEQMERYTRLAVCP